MGTLMESVAGASCYMGTINGICLVHGMNGTCSSLFLSLVVGVASATPRDEGRRSSQARRGHGTDAGGPRAPRPRRSRVRAAMAVEEEALMGGSAWLQLVSSRGRSSQPRRARPRQSPRGGGCSGRRHRRDWGRAQSRGRREASAWRCRRTERGRLFASRVGSHPKWVTRLPSLLELVLCG